MTPENKYLQLFGKKKSIMSHTTEHISYTSACGQLDITKQGSKLNEGNYLHSHNLFLAFPKMDLNLHHILLTSVAKYMDSYEQTDRTRSLNASQVCPVTHRILH